MMKKWKDTKNGNLKTADILINEEKQKSTHNNALEQMNFCLSRRLLFFALNTLGQGKRRDKPAGFTRLKNSLLSAALYRQIKTST